MDVDAEGSPSGTQTTVPKIKCQWCKKEKPCEDFEKYPTSNSRRKACNDCRQLKCKFCGCSFKSKSRARLPPNNPACEATQCKRKSECKRRKWRKCTKASCIYYRQKINPWILNDKGETTFKPCESTLRKEKFSTQQFHSQCRSCSGMSLDAQTESSVKQIEESVPMITCRWCIKEKPCEDFERYKKRYHPACNHCRHLYCTFCGDSFKSKSQTAVPPHYAVCEAKECKRKSGSMPTIECRWCKKEKPREDFERIAKTKRYHSTCNPCRHLYCTFCGDSFKTKSKTADPPHYPSCEAKDCKRKSAVKSIKCSNASCIYHEQKINPWILNNNGETTFHYRSQGHFSAQCRRCQPRSLWHIQHPRSCLT